MKIRKPSKKENLRLTVLVYGLTGSGKTQFCGTLQDCPETSPMLLINVGGGPNTLAGKDIDILSPRTLQEFQSIIRMLFEKNLKSGSKLQYKSVALDGITGFQQELSMPEIQGLRPAGQAETYNTMFEAVPPDRRDWLFSHEHSRVTLRAFRDLADTEFERHIHVVITALEKKDDVRSHICPDLPGKLGTEAGAYVDILARLSIETTEKNEKVIEYRKLWTSQVINDEGLGVLAKNRGGFLGHSTINPTMQKIYNKWNPK